MIDQLHVGEEAFRLEEPFTLFRNDKCVLKISDGAIVVPLYFNGESLGYFFHGEGKLLLDAVIETPRGAVGKPIERNIETPFIMIAPASKIEEIRGKLRKAENENLEQRGYANVGEAVEAARNLCYAMFRKSTFCRRPEPQSYVFGFQRKDAEKLDLLAAKGDKLVYICGENIFAFKRGKSIMIKSNRLVIAKNNKIITLVKPPKTPFRGVS